MTDGDGRGDGLRTPSVEKALRAIEAFLNHHAPMGLTELARRAGLERSAAQRVLHTLHLAGWLDKDPATRRYAPGLRFVECAYGYLQQDEMMRRAAPLVIELGRDLGETVNVARMDGTDIVYVQRIPTHRTRYIATVIGRRLPALNTSAGRSALACATEAEIDAACASWPLGCFTEHTVQDRGLIRDSVIEARRLGYAITEEQLMRNEIGLAAAIRDAGGAAIGAIQVSVSNLRWSQLRARAELAPAVVEVAAAVSAPPAPAG